MLSLPIYAQYDPRWANIELAPGYTMARWGCLVTSISMGLSNYGISITPGDLCLKLKAVGGFDTDANLPHDAIEKVYPNVSFYERVYTTNWPGDTAKVQASEAIKRIKNLVDLGHAVYLHVDNLHNDGIADHFVACKGYSSTDLLENNPDGGIEQWFSSKYGDPLSKLYGYYAIIGDPQNSVRYGGASFKAADVKKKYDQLPASVKKLVPIEIATYSKEILDDLVRS